MAEFKEGFSLRELLEMDKRIAVLETKMMERMDARDDARSLQAREYERRLDALNGEQTRLAKDREFMLPREKFDDFRSESEQITRIFRADLDRRFDRINEESQQWRELVNTYMEQNRGQAKGMALVWSVLISTTTLLIAGVAIWLR